ncbi:MAG: SpoIIE family protein phosphatase [Calditrichaceae bacterium]|nr:SpoIIE family protein phosphatase [Calditrichaceae bacterium]MBN2708566.1 SpoIIE family protein phosphatase [Calditrichaceae bacterium]RQV96875.1 MAG: hypothetical protein EH224_03205 [Calditrichota bacterium]
MSDNYNHLGLNKKDIELLSQYNLTYMLDKIKNQQEVYELQAMRLESALKRMEKNLLAAREAQMNLLPAEIRGVPELKFSARFVPSQYVSGDIYNIFRLDENNVGLYHIDIAGHGVAAALFSISLSHLLTTEASKRSLIKVHTDTPPYYKIVEPKEVITALDEDHYYEQFGIYFTMVYMIINIRKRLVKFCRAGHNPPIVIRRNGDIDVFTEGSFPIGWGFSRSDMTIKFKYEPGDILFLHSDGISDAENKAGKPFTKKRLYRHLGVNHKKPVNENLDLLFEKLKTFCGRDSYEDDLSIIGLEFLK